jgi:hypothetical protein
MHLASDKSGEALTDNTIKLIGYLGLLIASSFAVWKIVAKIIG